MKQRSYSRYKDTVILNYGDRMINGSRALINTTPYSDDFYHTVRQGDRIDTIAYKYYGRADLWWVIADYNTLMFPLVLEIGSSLRLPSTKHLFMDLLR